MLPQALQPRACPSQERMRARGAHSLMGRLGGARGCGAVFLFCLPLLCLVLKNLQSVTGHGSLWKKQWEKESSVGEWWVGTVSFFLVECPDTGSPGETGIPREVLTLSEPQFPCLLNGCSSTSPRS